MKADLIRTRVLLLVEDNPGDADLVSDLLDGARREQYQVVLAPRIADAIERLRALEVDVVVLDLRLPDCAGVESVKAIREHAREVPIVVLTGTDDEGIALECIKAGAQDYLCKAEVRAHSLQRAIGYAISRHRERQLRELQALLAQYRDLSSQTQLTSVTALLANSGAVARRQPATFEDLVREYFRLLQPYLVREIDQVRAPRDAMQHIITALGDEGGGPRDLLDLHVAALDRALAMGEDERSRSIVFEARLLALEMMGLLVDYYRVGSRRRNFDGARTR